MYRVRPGIRRRRPTRLRLGRDFFAAMVLLILGVALPFVSALGDPRPNRLTRQMVAEAQIVPAPQLAMPDGAVAAQTPGLPAPVPATTLPAQATLVPIAPTMESATAVPVLALDAGQAVSAAPILMYHYVRSVDAAVDPLGYELSVTPELFEQHMAWLAANGYTGIRVDTLVRCMQGEPRCPAQPVALSFDDGYADAFDAALPILQRYGFQATFYVVSGFVGQPGYLNWEQLANMRDAGMEIGSHSIDHPSLTRLEAPEITRQVVQSRATLEQQLGIAVTSFCYPSGDYDGFVREQVANAGYQSAVTTRWDDNTADLLALPRRRVAGGTTPEELGWIVAN